MERCKILLTDEEICDISDGLNPIDLQEPWTATLHIGEPEQKILKIVVGA